MKTEPQFTMSMYASMEDLHIAKAKYYQAKYEEVKKERDALQARLDALMFEYCPDDMTAKQVSAYAAAQRIEAYLDIPAFIRRNKEE